MKEFKLGKYPYQYRCDKCGHEFPVSKDLEDEWKDGYDIFSEEPLYYECEKCRDGTAKPIGYTPPEDFTNFFVALEPTEEEIEEWDKLFGPL